MFSRIRPGTVEHSATNDRSAAAPDTEEAEVISDERSSSHDSEPDRALRPILAIVIATAIFYLAKNIFIPLAVASVLALVLSQVVNRLERIVGRLIGALVVVAVAVVAVTAIGYLLTVELTSVAVELTAYSDNIAAKLSAVEKTTPVWLQRVEDAVKDVELQLKRSNPQPKQPKTTVTEAPAASFQQMMKPALPLLAGIADALLVVVLLFFLLYESRPLRARLVRLAARARITISAEAIDTASEVVSRYLLLYSLTNLAFGTAIYIVTLVLGLPHPWLWGLLAFLLRFIPYVGAFTSALLPTAVAFAISPGWDVSLEVLGSFLILDQLLAQFVEPLLIGHGIGVSAVALLVSAMYWAWLWGGVGLILAVPLTVCLKVAGDFIPALSFFSVLLGTEPASEGHQEFYRRLLERDQTGAQEMASRYCDEHGLEATFNDLLTPTVVLAGSERAEDHISEENQQFIIATIREVISHSGSRWNGVRSAPFSFRRVMGLCAPRELHSLGLLMLLEVLRREGAVVRFIPEDTTADGVREFVRSFSPEVLCLSCTLTEHLTDAVELVATLKGEFPNIVVIAGGPAAMAEAPKLLTAGCRQVCGDREQALRVLGRVRRFGVAATPRWAAPVARGPA